MFGICWLDFNDIYFTSFINILLSIQIETIKELNVEYKICAISTTPRMRVYGFMDNYPKI